MRYNSIAADDIPPAVDGIHVEDVMICKAMP